MVNESLTAELERYKERVAIFEQRLNVDLNKREKLIDSQMDDLIRNRNAKLAAFQQEIDTLKETLSNHVKEKESLSKTLTVFKTESKEKESKYIDKEIVLEKQNKELENIINENLRKERDHLKSIFKDQFDSIGKTHVQSKERYNSLIAQINAKSVENSDLNAQLQEKVFAITTLKNELRKLKGKNVVNTAVSKPNATVLELIEND
ncbi:hypothetical protein Tco_0812051 [Tanacetum coccineum]